MPAIDPQREIFGPDEVGPRYVIRTRGYAARPATGPAGETCGTCRHLCRIEMGAGRRVYRKCGLMRRLWTWSDRTEVRVSAPACERFTARGRDDAAEKERV